MEPEPEQPKLKSLKPEPPTLPSFLKKFLAFLELPFPCYKSRVLLYVPGFHLMN